MTKAPILKYFDVKVHFLWIVRKIEWEHTLQNQKKTKKDEELQLLNKYIQDGWPNHSNKVQENVRKYWNYREGIVQVKGAIYKANRTVITITWRSEMLRRLLHHMGIEKTILRTKEVIYWPFLYKEMKNLN